MRLLIILLLTIISVSSSGQRLIGKYHTYFGHSLELREDSTFRHEWRFDLAGSWATGQWEVSNGIVYLKVKNVYDTLIREGKADSLVLSADEQSSRIKFEEFAGTQLSSGGQSIELDKVTDRLAIRGKRLYQVSKTGQVLRTKQPGIWNRKKRPTYYFKVE